MGADQEASVDQEALLASARRGHWSSDKEGFRRARPEGSRHARKVRRRIRGAPVAQTGKGKRVLLVRAKVARDVIPRDLRAAGAQIDVVEAYETVLPLASRTRLRAVLANSARAPNVITFTSSSTVRNFVELLGNDHSSVLNDVKLASIGPVTSSTLRESGLRVDIEAREYTIPGLIKAIVLAQS